MPKVSIIMPTLNVVSYINACIESVLKQTLEDLEILVIDAGSDDGTIDVLNEYMLEDSRMKIIHSDVKSYGHQINLGIEMASGEYIGVVESDDVIEVDMYENLYNEAITGDYDFVKGYGRFFWELNNGLSYYADLRAFPQDKYEDGRIIFEGKECGIELMRFDYYLWLGIYRSDFIKKIRLNETPGAAFQDVGFLAQAYFNMKKASYLDKCVYNYRQSNPNSSSVNMKGYRYIFDENTRLSSMEIWKDDDWRRECLIKAFKQSNRRFQIMAYHEHYWEESDNEINSVWKMIRTFSGKLKMVDYLFENEREIFKLFMESPRKVYDYYLEKYTELKKIRNLFFEKIKDRRVIIFGCGKWGMFAEFLISEFDVANIEYFTDNNSKIWGTNISGKNVIEPAKLVDYIGDGLCIIANKNAAENIRIQLYNYGINDSQIVDYSLGMNAMLLS